MTVIIDQKNFGWLGRQSITPLSYQCGYCSNIVASVIGYRVGHHPDGSGGQVAGLYICPSCGGPTFKDIEGNQHPDVAFGTSVKSVPENVENLYNEARKCTSINAYTAAVMLCRKILMHLAVEQKAEVDNNFIYYVNYLADQGFVPPHGKHWVDHIRKKSNEANHEIIVMNRDDARDLIIFIEMLLKFIYEFPSMIPMDPKE
jgi:hypothetical protein